MSIDQVVNILALITLFEMMCSIGLGVTFADVVGVARNGRLVARAVLANYVCFPAAAVGLLLLFRPDPYVSAGFLIVAVCPGAPYGPPFTALARGNVTASVGLMVILAGSSAVLAPVLLYALLPLTAGDAKVRVDAGKMLGTLLLMQFLPLCLGLVVRDRRAHWAEWLKRPADRLCTVLNVMLLGTILVAQFSQLAKTPARAHVGMLVLLAVGVAAGWLLGERGPENRTAMAMATSVRNVGVGLVIATGSLPGTKAVTAVTTYAIFQTVAMAIAALAWGRLASRPRPDTEASTPPAFDRNSLAVGTPDRDNGGA